MNSTLKTLSLVSTVCFQNSGIYTQKNLTQEQPDGRNAQGKVQGWASDLPCPLQFGPQSPFVHLQTGTHQVFEELDAAASPTSQVKFLKRPTVTMYILGFLLTNSMLKVFMKLV